MAIFTAGHRSWQICPFNLISDGSVAGKLSLLNSEVTTGYRKLSIHLLEIYPYLFPLMENRLVFYRLRNISNHSAGSNNLKNIFGKWGSLHIIFNSQVCISKDTGSLLIPLALYFFNRPLHYVVGCLCYIRLITALFYQHSGTTGLRQYYLPPDSDAPVGLFKHADELITKPTDIKL
jgi:hypothetical protein